MPHTEAEGTPWTFGISDTGDIQLTENNTVRRVTGHFATLQDLKVALDSVARNPEQGVEGDDPRDPEFGLDVFGAIGSNQALKRAIRKTLEYDDYRHDRVSSVRRLRLVRHGGRDVTVHATISLTTEPDDITLVFDLFSGGLTVRGETAFL